MYSDRYDSFVPNVFWLFRSAYMFFFYYIHFGVTYKPKWAGYYFVNIFILSLDLFVHVTIIKIYNTIQYNMFISGVAS